MSGEIDGKTESGTPEANFTLSNNFAVVMGDERFYRLFGEKTLYTFNMLIHPKDRQDFESFMESEDVAAYAVVRCMTANDSYRWFMLEKNNELEGYLSGQCQVWFVYGSYPEISCSDEYDSG